MEAKEVRRVGAEGSEEGAVTEDGVGGDDENGVGVAERRESGGKGGEGEG